MPNNAIVFSGTNRGIAIYQLSIWVQIHRF